MLAGWMIWWACWALWRTRKDNLGNVHGFHYDENDVDNLEICAWLKLGSCVLDPLLRTGPSHRIKPLIGWSLAAAAKDRRMIASLSAAKSISSTGPMSMCDIMAFQFVIVRGIAWGWITSVMTTSDFKWYSGPLAPVNTHLDGCLKKSTWCTSDFQRSWRIGCDQMSSICSGVVHPG